jgi:hypothetical protein
MGFALESNSRADNVVRGDVLFAASVPERALFVRTGSSLTRVATIGDGVPGEPGAFFGVFRSFFLNDVGEWAVNADTSGTMLGGIFVSGGLPGVPAVPSMSAWSRVALGCALALFGVASRGRVRKLRRR